MSTPTTRRFPRSLADAFPDERANAIEVHRPTFNAWKFVDRLCAVLFVVLVGLVAVGAL